MEILLGITDAWPTDWLTDRQQNIELLTLSKVQSLSWATQFKLIGSLSLRITVSDLNSPFNIHNMIAGGSIFVCFLENIKRKTKVDMFDLLSYHATWSPNKLIKKQQQMNTERNTPLVLFTDIAISRNLVFLGLGWYWYPHVLSKTQINLQWGEAGIICSLTKKQHSLIKNVFPKVPKVTKLYRRWSEEGQEINSTCREQWH